MIIDFFRFVNSPACELLCARDRSGAKRCFAALIFFHALLPRKTMKPRIARRRSRSAQLIITIENILILRYASEHVL